MHVPRRGYWLTASCTPCLDKTAKPVVQCQRCDFKSCGKCDAVYTCAHCGLATCSKHEDDHGCRGVHSLIPLCLVCKSSKQSLYLEYCCEICQQPSCFSRACPSQIRTCSGSCHKDVCFCCGTWYFLPCEERPVVFYCHVCALNRNLLENDDILWHPGFRRQWLTSSNGRDPWKPIVATPLSSPR